MSSLIRAVLHANSTPAQLPTRFVFKINLKTAQAIHLAVLRPLLSRADQIVE